MPIFIEAYCLIFSTKVNKFWFWFNYSRDSKQVIPKSLLWIKTHAIPESIIVTSKVLFSIDIRSILLLVGNNFYVIDPSGFKNDIEIFVPGKATPSII